MIYIVLGLCLFSSLILTGAYRTFAVKKAIMDLPNERSSHAIPTPRGGGIVFTSLFYFLLTVLFYLNAIPENIFLSLLGGILVAIVGFCDDLFHLQIYWRFLAHCVAATWGIFWLHLPFDWTLFFAIFLTIWFINFYNFMDGIDGLAAGEAVFVALIAGAFLITRDQGLSVLCFGLASLMLGFLYWNWMPAKIFMGDIGSGFLGYVFAILMWTTAAQHTLSVLFWWILMGVFLIDATFTLLKRMLQGKKWYQSHCEHLYQQITQKGLSHARVTTYALCINIFVLLPLAFLLGR